jgi:hypothetical protein
MAFVTVSPTTLAERLVAISQDLLRSLKTKPHIAVGLIGPALRMTTCAYVRCTHLEHLATGRTMASALSSSRWTGKLRAMRESAPHRGQRIMPASWHPDEPFVCPRQHGPTGRLERPGAAVVRRLLAYERRVVEAGARPASPQRRQDRARLRAMPATVAQRRGSAIPTGSPRAEREMPSLPSVHQWCARVRTPTS